MAELDAIALIPAGVRLQPFVEYRPGLYYGPAGTFATAAPPADNLRASPFYLSRRLRIDSIGIETTANGEAGSLVRLGIYASKPYETYPGSLIVDAGTVAGDGGAAFKALPVDVAIGPGVVWLAIACQSAATTRPTLRWIAGTSYSGVVGMANGLVTNQTGAYVQAGVDGALPATFTDTPAATTGPMVMVRFA